MRPLYISAFAVAAAIATPTLAQDKVQKPPAQASTGEAQAGAMQALHTAREELRAATQQLEQANKSKDQESVNQARTQMSQAIDSIRQAMMGLPPEQRATLQEGLRQAEQGMQINDTTAAVQAGQRLDEAMGNTTDTVVALSTWRYDPLYAEGWSAEEIWNAEVFGPEGQEIGDIQNVLIGVDGEILSIVAEVGGFWDIGDTHINVPWDEVKVGQSLERVTIPVTEDNVQSYSLFKDWHLGAAEAGVETTDVDDDLRVGPHVWKLTDLLDDYVLLAGGVPYGYVDDVIFGRGGELQAVLVRPDVSWGAPGRYAYPYYAWGPAMKYHVLPYTRADIAGLQPFAYERLEGNEPAAG